ncbi:hypothetical protein DM01DRAFT_1001422 [Hesseltinella vesiculosa]|uniref:Uncharacterized protein n=1 Tax=Hesseltinella vesiculosa TaxID=101127 RepID=A0A1X2GX07_9FUNG|nr:hypothetical protein DM01DRAFT_1001422 [Hesseltinella vesiculosa]
MIQETKLSTCGPVDYSCQCAAHKLIQECFNLCPTYAAEASIHKGTLDSICAAVPVPSSSSATLLPSSTAVPSVSSVGVSPQPSTAHHSLGCEPVRWSWLSLVAMIPAFVYFCQ